MTVEVSNAANTSIIRVQKNLYNFQTKLGKIKYLFQYQPDDWHNHDNSVSTCSE